MEPENVTFSKNQSKSYTMTDLHILGDIDVNKILLLKKAIENILLDIMM